MTRWMGLDVGSRRIGVAISDPLKLTAEPLTTLERQHIRSDVFRVEQLVREYGVDRIIIGRPRHLSGDRSETSSLIEPFASALREALDLRIDWAEERLSTKEAERLMGDLGIETSERRARRDQFAAALILTWYLEETCSERG